MQSLIILGTQNLYRHTKLIRLSHVSENDKFPILSAAAAAATATYARQVT